MIRQLISTLFYGNIFYAFCTVALCMETSVLAGLPLNHWSFYTAVGFSTSIFYTLVYYISTQKINPQLVNFDWNNRSVWYSHNRKFVGVSLLLSCLALAASIISFVYLFYESILAIHVKDVLLLAVFPLVAFSYSFRLPFAKQFALRQLGLIKPFILGFAWAGFVTYYPLFATEIQFDSASAHLLPPLWLFLQNFLFISMLCVIFDIKDVQQDMRHNLRTIPVKIGVAGTIRYVIIPLILLNIVFKLMYMRGDETLFVPITIRTVPYLILVWLSLQVRKKRSTLYYLAIIDGMMLVKALTGILSTYF